MTAALSLIVLAALYFTPTIVAFGRKHETASVLVINLFLGWTFIGWVVALAMAVRGQPNHRRERPMEHADGP
ncbi:MAG: superinfection immunity protein [Bryobacteraceae bacterium]